MTFQELLNELTEATKTQRDKGTQFEKLFANYLLTDPQYANRLSDVWLWSEWSHRWGIDDGIDIVARERDTGNYWAIQCKFFGLDRTIEKKDVNSFLATSGKQFTTNEGTFSFANRIIVTTTDKWSSMADKALANQTIPVEKLRFQDLADSPIDWSQFSLANIKGLKLKKKNDVRPDQQEAIDSVLSGFQRADRGKMIMACGTGKTFTSLRLMERQVPANGRVLFLAPSISLVGQSLRAWTAQAIDPFHAFVVCSDNKVGRDEEDISTHDLAYPATTDAKQLVQVAGVLSQDRRVVVFSTYQSIQVVADAQKAGLGEFDLIICDEAHRTTGLTLASDKNDSEFVKVHDNRSVQGKKRLYMTATPRIFADKSKAKAKDADAVLYSMDDKALYGEELYRLGFGKAVDLGLLSEYKVLIVAQKEEEMAGLVNAYNKAVVDTESGEYIDIAFATKIIGSWKGLSKKGLKLVDDDGEEDVTEDTTPMRRAVAFSKSIKDSKITTKVFGELVNLYRKEHADENTGMVACALDHVDGTMDALKRQKALDWLKSEVIEGDCRILSNARCLSEGIDVPALDSVVFFDTRESIVDIVQSVGRVMRKAEGKKYGYIILPVCMPSEKVKDYNSFIETDPQFKGIWKIIKALRAHDESLVDEAEFRRKIKVITGGDEKRGEGDRGKQGEIDIDLQPLDIDKIEELVYAAIPKKLGDREYWSEWAKSIGVVAERLIARITALIASSPTMAKEFAKFVKGLQDTLNPAVSDKDAVEMLAQHILTLPVFQALFAATDFPTHNAVGKALQGIVARLDAAAVASETEGLEKFYANVRERVALAKSDKSKQDVIRNLYDTFFNNAFPRVAERLGIVYTPVQVVDFILHSADAALREHFGESLASPGVQILDPFSGTGTFPVRLIQSGLIGKGALENKYANELHANEIVLLAYYIATINIETAYHSVMGEYSAFDGMVLTDTFQMTEDGDLIDKVVLPENNAKVERQLAQPIRVIVGNPPYSVGKDSANTDGDSLSYPTLDGLIRTSYAEQSSATLVRNLYDSYIRAIRWASNRINERGIVAFVTNGSFLHANNMDGLRKCLTEDFSHLYIFNCRGDARTQGEERRKEAGGIFGEGSRTPVVISILVKNPRHQGPCELRYHDIGDYLSQEDKLNIIEGFGSISSVPWQMVRPNAEGDWVNQRDPAFEGFIPLGDKETEGNGAIFGMYSLGVSTNRDPWVYNMDRNVLEANVQRMIGVYNEERERYTKAAKAHVGDKPLEVDAVVTTDSKKISWSRSLKADVRKNKPLGYESDCIVQGMYRPFAKQWLYFNKRLNEMQLQQPKLFPTPAHRNIVISLTGIGASKPFSALVADTIPNLHLHDTGQTFPLYWYEAVKDGVKPQGDMFVAHCADVVDGYIRHDAISDWALETFQRRYEDRAISKDDIFWYVYGILHSPEYKQRFTTDLRNL